MIDAYPSSGSWLILVFAGVAVGFLGAYTTFSTFTYESNSLLEDGEWLRCSVNLFGSLLAGSLAHRYGAVFTVGAGGVLCIAAAGMAALLYRRRRKSHAV